MADWNTSLAEFVERPCRYRHRPEQGNLGYLEQPCGGHHRSFLSDLQQVSLLTHHRPLSLDIEWERLVLGREELAHLDGARFLGSARKESHLVGETDAHQRAPGALRAIHERGRDSSDRSDLAGLCNRPEDVSLECLGPWQRDALFGFGIVDVSPFARVTALSDEQHLDTELDSIGVPDSITALRPMTPLVIHRAGLSPLILEKIQLRRESQAVAGKRKGAGPGP